MIKLLITTFTLKQLTESRTKIKTISTVKRISMNCNFNPGKKKIRLFFKLY